MKDLKKDKAPPGQDEETPFRRFERLAKKVVSAPNVKEKIADRTKQS